MCARSMGINYNNNCGCLVRSLVFVLHTFGPILLRINHLFVHPSPLPDIKAYAQPLDMLYIRRFMSRRAILSHRPSGTIMARFWLNVGNYQLLIMYVTNASVLSTLA